MFSRNKRDFRDFVKIFILRAVSKKIDISWGAEDVRTAFDSCLDVEGSFCDIKDS